MLLASNQFCISQPQAVNFVLPAAHICPNLQPRFNSSPSPSCLSSPLAQTAKPHSCCCCCHLILPNFSSSGSATKVNSRWLHLQPVVSGGSPCHRACCALRVVGWSSGDLGVLVAPCAVSNEQAARWKVCLPEWPVSPSTGSSHLQTPSLFLQIKWR